MYCVVAMFIFIFARSWGYGQCDCFGEQARLCFCSPTADEYTLAFSGNYSTCGLTNYQKEDMRLHLWADEVATQTHIDTGKLRHLHR